MGAGNLGTVPRFPVQGHSDPGIGYPGEKTGHTSPLLAGIPRDFVLPPGYHPAQPLAPREGDNQGRSYHLKIHATCVHPAAARCVGATVGGRVQRNQKMKKTQHDMKKII